MVDCKKKLTQLMAILTQKHKETAQRIKLAKNDFQVEEHFDNFMESTLDQIRIISGKKASRYLFSALLATQAEKETDNKNKGKKMVTSSTKLDDETMEHVDNLFYKLRQFENKVREDTAGLLQEADDAVNAPNHPKEIKLGMRNVEILLAADKRMCTEIDVKVYESP